MNFDIFKIADEYHTKHKIPQHKTRPKTWNFNIDDLIEFHSEKDEYKELVKHLKSTQKKDKEQKTLIACPSDNKIHGLLNESTGSCLWIFGPQWYIENANLGYLFDVKLFTKTKTVKKKKANVKMVAAIFIAGIKGREVAHVLSFEAANPGSSLNSVRRFGVSDTFKTKKRTCVGTDAAHTYWHSL